MTSKSCFNDTAFFHTNHGIFNFNPNSRNILVLLFFFKSKFFSLAFFLGIHTSMPLGLCPMKPISCQSLILLRNESGSSSHIFLSWICPSYVEFSHTILRLVVHSWLFFILYVFYHHSIWLPVFIHRTLNRALRSIQQYLLTSFKNVYQPFGITVRQFTQRL